jgi:hypothetical protein
MWRHWGGEDDFKTVAKSLVGKNDRPGETEDERKRRQDEEAAVAAATSPGAFGGGVSGG